jgi:hypothetical protein
MAAQVAAAHASRCRTGAILSPRMADELCRKLTVELQQGVATEPQVVYLMAREVRQAEVSDWVLQK